MRIRKAAAGIVDPHIRATYAEVRREDFLEPGPVTRLIRGATVPDERCWLRGPGWCLAYE
jgi:hypothetical protein